MARISRPSEPKADARKQVPGVRARLRILPLQWVSLALLLVAALVAGLALSIPGSALADPVDGEIEDLRLSSPSPGELVINWDTPSQTPQPGDLPLAKTSRPSTRTITPGGAGIFPDQSPSGV